VIWLGDWCKSGIINLKANVGCCLQTSDDAILNLVKNGSPTKLCVVAFIINADSQATPAGIPNRAGTKKPVPVLKLFEQIRQPTPSLCFAEASNRNINVNKSHKREVA
jgi:hypothetical protein